MVSSRVVASDIGFTEGPVWTRDGRLLVTSISHGAIYEVGEGEAHVVAQTDGGPNGMAEGEDGTLYVTQNGGLYAGGTSPKPATPGIQQVAAGNVSYLACQRPWGDQPDRQTPRRHCHRSSRARLLP